MKTVLFSLFTNEINSGFLEQKWKSFLSYSNMLIMIKLHYIQYVIFINNYPKL